MRNFFRTLAPEKFTANVGINADGSCTYSYDGTLIFVPALLQTCRIRLDPRTEARLKKAGEQLTREGFRDVVYLGQGRYSAVLERCVPKGQASFFPSPEMKLFSILPQANGCIEIGTFAPHPRAPCPLFGTDAEIDGTLNIRIDRRLEVLGHNSPIIPVGDELSCTYQWHVDSADANPLIIVKARAKGASEFIASGARRALPKMQRY